MFQLLTHLQNPLFVALSAGLFVLVVVFLLFRMNLIRDLRAFAFVIALAAGAAALRVFPLDFESNDYTAFLSEWVKFFRARGGFPGLRERIGDYNFPYLYFLAFFSILPLEDLYLIKLLSIAFDLMVAVYVLLLVSLNNKKPLALLSAFFLPLYLPTVWVNSALWAQCDSIYTAFGLMGLYYGLKGRPWLSVAAAALAFSFKLQIIFLLPIYAILLIARKIRMRHLGMFPLTYLVTVLPALLLGRPLIDVVKIYTNQVGTYSAYLTLNAPSIYALFPRTENAAFFSPAGILGASALLVFLLYYSFLRRALLTDRAILLMAAFMVIAVPFLLPSMHERYFYLADVLSVVTAFLIPRRFYLPLLTQYGSWSGYSNYLLGGGVGIRNGALAMLAAGLFIGQSLYTELLEHKTTGQTIDHPIGQ